MEIKMIKISKITILLAFITILSSLANAEETKKDCSNIKNLHKKILCKANNTTSSLESKKTLSEFLSPDESLEGETKCSKYKSLHKKLLCVTNLRKED